MTEPEVQQAVDSFSQEVIKTFDNSLTGTRQPRASKCTNAPLDPPALKVLLARNFGRDIQIVTLHTTVTSTACRVLYGVDKPPNSGRNEMAYVEFTQCRTATDAEEMMKRYLSSFERALTELMETKIMEPASIGIYSLRTTQSVFWVRDTIFAEVSVGHGECVSHTMFRL